MELISEDHPLLIFVGSGGVGKTTLAAATGVLSVRSGRDTLVMTFDPSLRLKQALGVGEEAREHEVPVDLGPLG
ncbi:MAG TPA: ArsA-related P-loop ATPase, partial [Thermoanaerobaculia bacterium]|nr:ArsA-related P-loop ATPase [Thermoanaerobaculia bacterium]